MKPFSEVVISFFYFHVIKTSLDFPEINMTIRPIFFIFAFEFFSKGVFSVGVIFYTFFNFWTQHFWINILPHF